MTSTTRLSTCHGLAAQSYQPTRAIASTACCSSFSAYTSVMAAERWPRMMRAARTAARRIFTTCVARQGSRPTALGAAAGAPRGPRPGGPAWRAQE